MFYVYGISEKVVKDNSLLMKLPFQNMLPFVRYP